MDSVIDNIIEHGGWGSVAFIIAAGACVMLWRRNNELTDQKDVLVKERNSLTETVKELRTALDTAIAKAASDRERMLSEIAKLKNGGT